MRRGVVMLARLAWWAVPLGTLATVADCVFYQPIEPSMVWHPFEATAYCDYGFTASGVWVREGIVAGDPRVLPLGSEIDIKLDGEVLQKYQVMDVGSAIKGYIIDIWMPTCEEAVRFGRREVKVRVRKRGTLRG
ncbi:MAG: 3D domain-containing protein [Gemmatimonadota bacterium]|nr:MAG: 3D domain-containing protein [Gemmatimonadota bacterium]